MSRFVDFFTSLIWRKSLMAATGLTWIGFVFAHLLGNMLIFAGPRAYNTYSHNLLNSGVTPVIELVLALFILMHAFTGVLLFGRNHRTKPKKYAMGPSGAKNAGSVASKTMIYTGLVVAAFIILHLATFKYGTHYTATYDGIAMRDLHRLVIEVFREPGYQVWYFVALALVGVHLYHGFSSSFQTLGIHHPRYNPAIKGAGVLYAVVVAVGFISLPLYVMLFA